MRAEPRVDFMDDCDSEGNDPPQDATFIDPNSIDETLHPPPRTNEPIKLPFFEAKQRRPMRERYESRVGFEDWVEDAEEAGHRNRQAGIVKLEDDANFPVGRPYFWQAYCVNTTCNRLYHPHIPGTWTCVTCLKKVWQPPEVPESRNCAVCFREVAKIVMVAGRRVRNPMTLNANWCKCCGRIVCDGCYSPQKFNVSEYGYTEDQRVCTKCAKMLTDMRRPPDDEDLGTLHEEHVVGDVLERNMCHRHWVPKCNRCNITYAKPPRKWACTSCALHVWQPPEAPDSQSCWLCGNQHPKTRCHDCGQLVCHTCGAYAQPVPHRGFTYMNALSVCKGCYRGVSVQGSKGGGEAIVKPLYKAKCSQCKQPCGGTPEMWLSRCHKAKAWQTEGTTCATCGVPVTGPSGENCRRCGRLVCPLCAQYKEPVPERGFDKTKPETVCKECYRPDAVFGADPSDFAHWPPVCFKCELRFNRPPDRWRCTNQCGAVWQPTEHMASRCCWCCGKKLGGQVVNCRKCGRLVCSGCGEGRSEIPELGFTRGVAYPTCKRCLDRKEEPDISPAPTTPAASQAPASQEPSASPSTTAGARGATPASIRGTPTPASHKGHA